MNRLKGILVVSCIASMFLFVYGTALILRLIFGKYLLEGGLFDLNYLFLTFLCSIPFLFFLLIKKNHSKKEYFISGTLFSILYVYVNFLLVFSLVEMTAATEMRILIVFPVTALILAMVSHFICQQDIKIVRQQPESTLG
jgi:hypothetical protein